MRYYYDTDCALIAGGTIRAGMIYPPGILRLKDIVDWLVHFYMTPTTC
jgi:5'-nucleotidase